MPGDRAALIAFLCFVALIGAGDAIGHLFEKPVVGMMLGFCVALGGVIAGPWLMPRALDDWIHESWP